jgi:hypothetical protein
MTTKAKEAVKKAAAKKPAPDLGATSPGATQTQTATPAVIPDTPPPATPQPQGSPATDTPVALEVVPKGASTPTPARSAGGSAPSSSELATPSEKDVKAFKIKESTRDVREIISQYVVVSEHGDSLQIKGELPLEEFLPLLDYLTSLHENTGFLIGDALVAGAGMYKEKLLLAMAKTGRSLNTLKQYLSVAKNIPPSIRRPALGFIHHQRVVPIALNDAAGGVKKAEELLKIAEKGADGKRTEPMPVREFSQLVKKATPAKKKSPAKNSGKRGPKSRAEKSAAKDLKNQKGPRKLTEAEVAASDALHEQLIALSDAAVAVNKALEEKPTEKADLREEDKGTAPTLLEAIAKCDYATKTGFINAMPTVTLQALVKAGEYIKMRQGYPGGSNVA